MTLFWRMIFITFFWFAGRFALAAKCDQVHFDGLNRTSEDWIRHYLDLNSPTDASTENVDALRKKLLTTEVFQSVSITVEQLTPESCRLYVQVVEKWTLIPVVRATVGGGTPMLVAGVYDTHSLGRLWTLGGEFRKYGESKPGHVVWARAPRWGKGRKVLSLEYWNMFRERAVQFDDDFQVAQKASTANRMLRLYHLVPMFDPMEQNSSGLPLLFGIDLRVRQDSSPVFSSVSDGIASSSDEIDSDSDQENGFSIAPTIQWDNIAINALRGDGSKILAHYGVIKRGEKTSTKVDLDFFHYQTWPKDFGTAVHAFFGKTSSDSFNDRYFLGGFDSVRGYPDGIQSGQRCAFVNFELRNNFASQRFANWEAAAFYDIGFTESETPISSYGVGLRMAVPQVNRLLLRMDFARSVDGRTSGANIGLNQFFQPHRPL